MAIYEQTSRGIEYNTDVNDDADVLRDMENLAKTTNKAIDDAVEEATYDDSDDKNRLSAIETEQIVQNEQIQRRALTTETGAKLVLSIDNTTYKLKAILKDKNNNTIDTSNEIDLPIESMIINASYNSGILTLTLQSGQTIDVNISDLISGLQTEITSSNKLLSDLVDDTNQTNKFTTQAEKQKLAGIEAEANKTIVDNELNDESTNPVQNKVITGHIEKLKTENTRLKSTLPETEGEGENITLDKTAEIGFKTPPLPRGNTKQESYSGKNLFNKDDYTSTNLYANGSVGTIVNLSTGSSQFGFIFNVSKYDLLTISKVISKRFGVYGLVDYPSVSSTATILQARTSSNEFFTYDFTDFNYIIVTYYSSNDDTLSEQEILNSIQIEEGSTATEYEPYVGGYASPNIDYPQKFYNLTGDVEVKVENKNLFNKTTATQNALLNVSGQIVSQPGVSDENGFISDYIFLKAGVNYYNNTRGYSNAGFYDLNKTFIERTTLNQSAIVTVLNDCYVRLNGKMGYLDTFQFEKGLTATPYTPHQDQTFTFPLGTEKMYLGDYLADDGIHHVRNRQIVNSSSIIEYISTYKYFRVRLDHKSISNRSNPFSNYFSKVTANGTRIASANTAFYVWLFDENGIFEADVANFKAFADECENNNNPLAIEYNLEKEEITPYTPAQQEVYNAIKEAISYEGQTNISGSSEEANPIFEVEAYQSTKLILDEIDNLKARVSLLE